MANFLKSLFVKGIEIDTDGATTNQVLKYNGTKFAPAADATGAGSGALDDLTDVIITSPEEFQGLYYNGTNWVNSHIPLVSYVQNAETTTITTGTCVYLFGGTGDHASVKKADNSSDTTSSKTIGVVGASIAASQNGPIITRGYVDGIDLSTGYTAGDVLWLGTNGAFTKTKPTAPAHLVFIGVVVRATNNGIIYVATQNGYELDEIHNVQIDSGTLASGDFLKYNGSLWVNDPINLGTDTVGNYMTDVSAGTGITVTHTPGEGSTATIAVTANTYQPLDADLTAIAALTGTSGFLKTNGASTWSVDTNTYLTGNQTITLSGDATGSGTTAITVAVVDDSHNHAIGTSITGLGTGVATFLETPSSANLASAVTGETGSGALVFGTSPLFTTPKIASTSYIADYWGEPLISVPAVTGSLSLKPNHIRISNTATGGTPSISAVSGTDTDVNLSLTGQGSGVVKVNGLTVTSSTGTLTVSNGKTLTLSNTLTFTGTDSSSVDFGAGGTVLYSAVASANQIIYKNSSNVATGSSGLTYDGTSIKVNGNLESVYTNGDEGGEIFLNKATTNTTITTGVTIDVNRNYLRIFENGGTNRGYYLDITSAGTSVSTPLLYNGYASPSITTSLTTGSTTFSLVNTTATTVNFAGAATTINIGGTGATTAFTGAITATGTITSNGLIKSNGRFDADDSLGFWVARDNDGTVLFRADVTDTVYNDVITGRAVIINSAGTMGTASSTLRRKTEVSNYTFDTQAVLAIQPVRFKYKPEILSEDDDTGWQYGVVAEQVLEAGVPELVGIDADGLPDYFAYERLCVAQQQVIRELWAKVEALEAKVG